MNAYAMVCSQCDLCFLLSFSFAGGVEIGHPIRQNACSGSSAAMPYLSAYTADGGGMGVGGAEPPQEQICKLFIGGLTLTTTKCKMI